MQNLGGSHQAPPNTRASRFSGLKKHEKPMFCTERRRLVEFVPSTVLEVSQAGREQLAVKCDAMNIAHGCSNAAS